MKKICSELIYIYINLLWPSLVVSSLKGRLEIIPEIYIKQCKKLYEGKTYIELNLLYFKVSLTLQPIIFEFSSKEKPIKSSQIFFKVLLKLSPHIPR